MPHARGPVILIASQHAGHAANAGAEDSLQKAGVVVAQRIDVAQLDELEPQGRAWRGAGIAAAVAAGGDGTIGAVASHVAGTGLPLGILPLGTANDIARSLAIPLAMDAASNVIAHGVVAEIDIGQAKPAATEPGAAAALADAQATGLQQPEVAQLREQTSSGAYFLHALTLGLNVEFARLATDVARRQQWGPLTYAASALEALTHFHPMAIAVRLEGVTASAYGLRMPQQVDAAHHDGLTVDDGEATRTLKGEVVQLAAVVTPVFGGGANLRLPDVSLQDRLLDFVVIEAPDRRHLHALIERLSRGTQAGVAPGRSEQDVVELDLPGVWRFKARSAVIMQPADADVTLDGEIRGRTPIEITLAPGGLSVILPSARVEEDVRE